MSAAFAATPAELGLVNQIFARADQQKLGILNGEVAVQVFGGAKLPGSVLGEIWNIADEENNGWLSKTGAAKAVRLIAHAQNGEKVSAALLSKPAPLPTIEGYSIIQQQATGSSTPLSPTFGFPPLSPQDKNKFQNIFNRSGPSNGLLNGDKARDIFLKSKLSNDQLLQIWNLADTRNRGVLDITDFTIAMYYIQGLMTQKISFVPTALPQGLYEQAGGPPSNVPSVATHLSGNSGSFSPVVGNFGQLQPQTTGQNQPLSPSHSGFIPQRRTPIVPARPSVTEFRAASDAHENGHNAWDVTPTEKAEADAIFDGELDTKKIGFIEGDAAVPFMLKSRLPGEDLAQIWDLADINSDGRLSRDGFAIAYHLIKNKLRGQPIPAQLPPSLIPPSLRSQASLFQTSPQPQPEPPRDLLDFDDTPPTSAVSPQMTGNLPVLQPQSTGATAVPTIPLRNTVSDPFASSPFTATANNDLLGDHDHRPQTTSPLQDQSAELGNIKNQLQSTNKSLDATRAERAKLESTLASQAAELSALQTQLSSAKAAYDTESTLLAQLKERHATQTSEIQKSREDLIRSESDLSAIRVEKAEIEQALLRDKEEARDLHRRMMETSQQADGLKVEVEKSKKEAKQQKGRLAIARKQLLTKETEKAKMEKELEEADVEVRSIVQEIQGVENQLNMSAEEPQPKRTTSPDSVAIAAAQPLPASPELISPNKSNNPFERLAISSGSSSPRSQSPFLSLNTGSTSSSTRRSEDQDRRETPESKSSFDDFFGVDESNTNQEDNKPTQANGEATPKEADEASPTTVTDTEHFVTPPSTAKNETLLESSENLANTATARFPSVDDPSSLKDDAGTEKNQDSARAVTDLDTNLQELEVEEPDSDESDDDHRPLSEIAQQVKEKTNLAVDHNVNADDTTEQNGLPPGRAKDSFDNIFGSNITPAPQSVSTSEAPNSACGTSNISKSVQLSEPPKQNATAGANAFDETLTGFSSPSPPIPGQFKFDAFEDSFDFGAAGGTQPGPSSPEARLSASKTTASPTTLAASTSSPLNFDDISASPNTSSVQQRAVSAPMSNGVTPEVDPSKPTSFDDAFASFGTSPNLNLEPSLGHGVPAGTSTSDSMGVQGPKPFSSSPGPTSPRTVDTVSSRRSINRATSPARSASPPIRMGSPVPRPSTSSKDSHEKKDSTRHSKLSIRFPFGKKKNKSTNPESLPPASLLSPPMEDLDRTITPASDDDVEAVKQITAMGFSRSQAVEALEKYGYDVQRATNSLLQ